MGFNEASFWSKVNMTKTCWLWTGYKNKDGYGEYKSDFLTTRLAHRISFGLDQGYLEELPLDHLCRNRHCVNPDHLEFVTTKVNTRRSNVGLHESAKTHCPHGHPYDEENTLHYNGKRFCRTCKNDRNRARRKATR
jgi:hypothetical protein